MTDEWLKSRDIKCLSQVTLLVGIRPGFEFKFPKYKFSSNYKWILPTHSTNVWFLKVLMHKHLPRHWRFYGPQSSQLIQIQPLSLQNLLPCGVKGCGKWPSFSSLCLLPCNLSSVMVKLHLPLPINITLAMGAGSSLLLPSELNNCPHWTPTSPSSRETSLAEQQHPLLRDLGPSP